MRTAPHFLQNSPSPAGATKAEAAAKHRARTTALKERAMVLVEGRRRDLGLTLIGESAKNQFNNPFHHLRTFEITFAPCSVGSLWAKALVNAAYMYDIP
jgi:hypothetical protein